MIPLYYFCVRGPDRNIPDHHGLELDGLVAAREVALQTAADVLSEMTGNEHYPDWRFEITDAAGQMVLTIPFSEATVPER